MPTASNVTRLRPDRDSESLPKPFLPPDVDLTGFHYLPVMPDRLMGSPEWSRARRDPPFLVRFIGLLMAAFRQKPAGSLPNDDEAFADALGVDDEKWAEIKESTLRGWTLCSDGRWHHPLAAAFVAEAWKGRQANQNRTNKANEANAERRAEKQRDAERDAQRDAERNADVTSHQGREGKEANQSKEDNEPKESSAPVAAAPKQHSGGANKGKRFPSDWRPTEGDVTYAKEHGWNGADIAAQAENFRDYFLAKPGAMSTDWSLNWKRWVRETRMPSARGTSPLNRGGSARNPYDL